MIGTLNKEVLKSGEFVYHKTEKGKIKEFFDHLLVYGGASFDKGILRIWGDPSLFTPLEGFVIYYHYLKKCTGKYADEIFYWLGHLYGKNSTLMLMKKFGFDKRKVADFVNGATQDGFGYMDVEKLKYTNTSFDGKVEGTNSNFAIRYSKKYGIQETPVDFYMAGILSGGSEPLFGFPIEAKEIKCMAQGKKHCIYAVKSTSKTKTPEFFKKINLNEKLLRKRTGILGRKRKIKFSIFKKPDIKFGDGSFYLNNYQGFNLASYEHVLLDKFSYLLLGEKKFFKLKEIISKKYIKATLNKNLKSDLISKKSIQNLLEHLKIFGFGELKIYYFKGKKIIIKNLENPYLSDSYALFRKIDSELGLDMPAKLLKHAFKIYFNKECTAEPLKINPKISSIKITLS